MKVLITGASGLLGTAVTDACAERGYPVTVCPESELDVTDPERCAGILARNAPEVVIHCAAYTAVDRAEEEREAAFAVNEGGARNVARAAAAVDALMLYPSTDYVFGGQARERPWRPDDPVAPRGVYARSKWAGEEAVRRVGAEHLIVRTSWLYGPGGSNFVDTIRRLAASRPDVRVVDDQRGRPTWAPALARTLLDLVASGARGTVHAADRGTATWFELARAAVQLTGLPGRIVPVSTEAFGAAAPRPPWSVLDLEATERRLGRRLPHWRANLRRHLAPPGADRGPERAGPPVGSPTTSDHPVRGRRA